MIRLTLKETNEILIVNIVSTMTNHGDTLVFDSNNSCYRVNESIEEIEDMLLRDKFAMSALSGLLSSHKTFDLESEYFGLDAYNIAEQMLKQRKEK